MQLHSSDVLEEVENLRRSRVAPRPLRTHSAREHKKAMRRHERLAKLCGGGAAATSPSSFLPSTTAERGKGGREVVRGDDADDGATTTDDEDAQDTFTASSSTNSSSTNYSDLSEGERTRRAARRVRRREKKAQRRVERRLRRRERRRRRKQREYLRGAGECAGPIEGRGGLDTGGGEFVDWTLEIAYEAYPWYSPFYPLQFRDPRVEEEYLSFAFRQRGPSVLIVAATAWIGLMCTVIATTRKENLSDIHTPDYSDKFGAGEYGARFVTLIAAHTAVASALILLCCYWFVNGVPTDCIGFVRSRVAGIGAAAETTDVPPPSTARRSKRQKQASWNGGDCVDDDAFAGGGGGYLFEANRQTAARRSSDSPQEAEAKRRERQRQRADAAAPTDASRHLVRNARYSEIAVFVFLLSFSISGIATLLDDQFECHRSAARGASILLGEAWPLEQFIPSTLPNATLVQRSLAMAERLYPPMRLSKPIESATIENDINLDMHFGSPFLRCQYQWRSFLGMVCLLMPLVLARSVGPRFSTMWAMGGINLVAFFICLFGWSDHIYFSCTDTSGRLSREELITRFPVPIHPRDDGNNNNNNMTTTTLPPPTTTADPYLEEEEDNSSKITEWDVAYAYRNQYNAWVPRSICLVLVFLAAAAYFAIRLFCETADRRRFKMLCAARGQRELLQARNKVLARAVAAVLPPSFAEAAAEAAEISAAMVVVEHRRALAEWEAARQEWEWMRESERQRREEEKIEEEKWDASAGAERRRGKRRKKKDGDGYDSDDDEEMGTPQHHWESPVLLGSDAAAGVLPLSAFAPPSTLHGDAAAAAHPSATPCPTPPENHDIAAEVSRRRIAGPLQNGRHTAPSSTANDLSLSQQQQQVPLASQRQQRSRSSSAGSARSTHSRRGANGNDEKAAAAEVTLERLTRRVSSKPAESFSVRGTFPLPRPTLSPYQLMLLAAGANANSRRRCVRAACAAVEIVNSSWGGGAGGAANNSNSVTNLTLAASATPEFVLRVVTAVDDMFSELIVMQRVCGTMMGSTNPSAAASNATSFGGTSTSASSSSAAGGGGRQTKAGEREQSGQRSSPHPHPPHFHHNERSGAPIMIPLPTASSSAAAALGLSSINDAAAAASASAAAAGAGGASSARPRSNTNNPNNINGAQNQMGGGRIATASLSRHNNNNNNNLSQTMLQQPRRSSSAAAGGSLPPPLQQTAAPTASAAMALDDGDVRPRGFIIHKLGIAGDVLTLIAEDTPSCAAAHFNNMRRRGRSSASTSDDDSNSGSDYDSDEDNNMPLADSPALALLSIVLSAAKTLTLSAASSSNNNNSISSGNAAARRGFNYSASQQQQQQQHQRAAGPSNTPSPHLPIQHPSTAFRRGSTCNLLANPNNGAPSASYGYNTAAAGAIDPQEDDEEFGEQQQQAAAAAAVGNIRLRIGLHYGSLEMGDVGAEGGVGPSANPLGAITVNAALGPALVGAKEALASAGPGEVVATDAFLHATDGGRRLRRKKKMGKSNNDGKSQNATSTRDGQKNASASRQNSENAGREGGEVGTPRTPATPSRFAHIYAARQHHRGGDRLQQQQQQQKQQPISALNNDLFSVMPTGMTARIQRFHSGDDFMFAPAAATSSASICSSLCSSSSASSSEESYASSSVSSDSKNVGTRKAKTKRKNNKKKREDEKQKREKGKKKASCHPATDGIPLSLRATVDEPLNIISRKQRSAGGYGSAGSGQFSSFSFGWGGAAFTMNQQQQQHQPSPSPAGIHNGGGGGGLGRNGSFLGHRLLSNSYSLGVDGPPDASVGGGGGGGGETRALPAPRCLALTADGQWLRQQPQQPPTQTHRHAGIGQFPPQQLHNPHAATLLPRTLLSPQSNNYAMLNQTNFINGNSRGNGQSATGFSISPSPIPIRPVATYNFAGFGAQQQQPHPPRNGPPPQHLLADGLHNQHHHHHSRGPSANNNRSDFGTGDDYLLLHNVWSGPESNVVSLTSPQQQGQGGGGYAAAAAGAVAAATATSGLSISSPHHTFGLPQAQQQLYQQQQQSQSQSQQQQQLMAPPISFHPNPLSPQQSQSVITNNNDNDHHHHHNHHASQGGTVAPAVIPIGLTRTGARPSTPISLSPQEALARFGDTAGGAPHDKGVGGHLLQEAALLPSAADGHPLAPQQRQQQQQQQFPNVHASHANNASFQQLRHHRGGQPSPSEAFDHSSHAPLPIPALQQHANAVNAAALLGLAATGGGGGANNALGAAAPFRHQQATKNKKHKKEKRRGGGGGGGGGNNNNNKNNMCRMGGDGGLLAAAAAATAYTGGQSCRVNLIDPVGTHFTGDVMALARRGGRPNAAEDGPPPYFSSSPSSLFSAAPPPIEDVIDTLRIAGGDNDRWDGKSQLDDEYSNHQQETSSSSSSASSSRVLLLLSSLVPFSQHFVSPRTEAQWLAWRALWSADEAACLFAVRGLLGLCLVGMGIWSCSQQLVRTYPPPEPWPIKNLKGPSGRQQYLPPVGFWGFRVSNYDELVIHYGEEVANEEEGGGIGEPGGYPGEPGGWPGGYPGGFPGGWPDGSPGGWPGSGGSGDDDDGGGWYEDWDDSNWTEDNWTWTDDGGNGSLPPNCTQPNGTDPGHPGRPDKEEEIYRPAAALAAESAPSFALLMIAPAISIVGFTYTILWQRHHSTATDSAGVAPLLPRKRWRAGRELLRGLVAHGIGPYSLIVSLMYVAESLCVIIGCAVSPESSWTNALGGWVHVALLVFVMPAASFPLLAVAKSKPFLRTSANAAAAERRRGGSSNAAATVLCALLTHFGSAVTIALVALQIGLAYGVNDAHRRGLDSGFVLTEPLPYPPRPITPNTTTTDDGDPNATEDPHAPSTAPTAAGYDGVIKESSMPVTAPPAPQLPLLDSHDAARHDAMMERWQWLPPKQDEDEKTFAASSSTTTKRRLLNFTEEEGPPPGFDPCPTFAWGGGMGVTRKRRLVRKRRFRAAAATTPYLLGGGGNSTNSTDNNSGPDDRPPHRHLELVPVVTTSTVDFLLGRYDPKPLDDPSVALAYAAITALWALFLCGVVVTECHGRALRRHYAALLHLYTADAVLLLEEDELLRRVAGVVPRPLQQALLRLAMQCAGGETRVAKNYQRQLRRANNSAQQQQLADGGCSVVANGGGGGQQLVVSSSISGGGERVIPPLLLRFPMTRGGLLASLGVGLALPRVTNSGALPVRSHGPTSIVITIRIDHCPPLPPIAFGRSKGAKDHKKQQLQQQHHIDQNKRIAEVDGGGVKEEERKKKGGKGEGYLGRQQQQLLHQPKTFAASPLDATALLLHCLDAALLDAAEFYIASTALAPTAAGLCLLPTPPTAPGAAGPLCSAVVVCNGRVGDPPASSAAALRRRADDPSSYPSARALLSCETIEDLSAAAAPPAVKKASKKTTAAKTSSSKKASSPLKALPSLRAPPAVPTLLLRRQAEVLASHAPLAVAHICGDVVTIVGPLNPFGGLLADRQKTPAQQHQTPSNQHPQPFGGRGGGGGANHHHPSSPFFTGGKAGGGADGVGGHSPASPLVPSPLRRHEAVGEGGVSGYISLSAFLLLKRLEQRVELLNAMAVADAEAAAFEALAAEQLRLAVSRRAKKEAERASANGIATAGGGSNGSGNNAAGKTTANEISTRVSPLENDDDDDDEDDGTHTPPASVLRRLARRLPPALPPIRIVTATTAGPIASALALGAAVWAIPERTVAPTCLITGPPMLVCKDILSTVPRRGAAGGPSEEEGGGSRHRNHHRKEAGRNEERGRNRSTSGANKNTRNGGGGAPSPPPPPRHQHFITRDVCGAANVAAVDMAERGRQMTVGIYAAADPLPHQRRCATLAALEAARTRQAVLALGPGVCGKCGAVSRLAEAATNNNTATADSSSPIPTNCNGAIANKNDDDGTVFASNPASLVSPTEVAQMRLAILKKMGSYAPGCGCDCDVSAPSSLYRPPPPPPPRVTALMAPRDRVTRAHYECATLLKSITMANSEVRPARNHTIVEVHPCQFGGEHSSVDPARRRRHQHRGRRNIDTTSSSASDTD